MGVSTANVTLLQKPDDINPVFNINKNEELTWYKVYQLKAETKKLQYAYLTQEETSKECVKWLQALLDMFRLCTVT